MSTVVLIAVRHEPEIEAMLSNVPDSVELRYLPVEDAVPTNEGRLVGKSPDLKDLLPGVEIVFGSVGETNFPYVLL